VLSESNAILWYLSGGTKYRPDGAFGQARVFQWLSFEADYVQTSIGSLRFWALTGKLSARPPSLIEGKRVIALRALGILDRELSNRPFITGGAYSVADISLFAYAHLANDAGIATGKFRSFEDWIDRVKSQEGHLAEMYPYSIDPYSSAELPNS
jgi:glutathione S-transferase